MAKLYRTRYEVFGSITITGLIRVGRNYRSLLFEDVKFLRSTDEAYLWLTGYLISG